MWLNRGKNHSIYVLLYEDLTKLIIGAALEVHYQLGPGFLESVYENALASELVHRQIRLQRQNALFVMYKGESMGKFRPDMLVEDKIIIEIKAASHIASQHVIQAIHYLTATGLRLALLLNFGTPKLGIRRVIK